MSAIQYEIGDVLNASFDKPTIICHVVNDRGKWGSGFVVPLGKKYPKVESAYRDWYNITESDYILDHVGDFESDVIVPFVLGQVQFNRVRDNLYIGNMIAQSQPGGCGIKIGDTGVHLRPIRLECLRECLLRVAKFAKDMNADVVGPMFASGLAGASWDDEVVPLIEECLCKYGINVTIYKLQ